MALKIVETSLRDGHQSLFATRMNTEEVLSVLKELDDAGYHAIEVWGGAPASASSTKTLGRDFAKRKLFARRPSFRCFSEDRTSSDTATTPMT